MSASHKRTCRLVRITTIEATYRRKVLLTTCWLLYAGNGGGAQMKQIVQILSDNEETTLRETLADIPRACEGMDEVEIFIIDDGSTEPTVPLALQLGADNIVQPAKNKGLARAFRSEIDTCPSLGADIIVNTNVDNQYTGRDSTRDLDR